MTLRLVQERRLLLAEGALNVIEYGSIREVELNLSVTQGRCFARDFKMSIFCDSCFL